MARDAIAYIIRMTNGTHKKNNTAQPERSFPMSINKMITCSEIFFAIFGVYGLLIVSFAIYNITHAISIARDSIELAEIHFGFGMTWFVIGMLGLFLSGLGLSLLEHIKKTNKKGVK